MLLSVKQGLVAQPAMVVSLEQLKEKPCCPCTEEYKQVNRIIATKNLVNVHLISG
jgi:hypothetical protein